MRRVRLLVTSFVNLSQCRSNVGRLEKLFTTCKPCIDHFLAITTPSPRTPRAGSRGAGDRPIDGDTTGDETTKYRSSRQKRKDVALSATWNSWFIESYVDSAKVAPHPRTPPRTRLSWRADSGINVVLCVRSTMASIPATLPNTCQLTIIIAVATRLGKHYLWTLIITRNWPVLAI